MLGWYWASVADVDVELILGACLVFSLIADSDTNEIEIR